MKYRFETLFLAVRHASERMQHKSDYNAIPHSQRACHVFNHCLKTVLRHSIIFSSLSIIGLRVFLKKSELCLINVYLPYCCRANTDEFLAHLGKLRQLCEELQCPNICFVGDFNAGTTNIFGGLLEDFCMENDFIVCDHALPPQINQCSGGIVQKGKPECHTMVPLSFGFSFPWRRE